MPLFHKDDKRRRLALIIAMAAHVERNTSQVFPKATTDRLEDAADELLGDGPISFETAMVVKRALQSLDARPPGRPWGGALVEALQAIDDES